MKKFPHLVRQYHTWSARIGIPREVRHKFGGKTFFVCSTHETHEEKAYAVAAPIIAGWRAEIAAARADLPSPFEKSVSEALTAIKASFNRPTKEQIEKGISNRAPPTEVDPQMAEYQAARQSAKALRDFQATQDPIVKLLVSKMSGILALAQKIVEPEQPKPPFIFLSHLDAWMKTRREGKTLDQYVSDIRKFSATVPEIVEDWAPNACQLWIDERLADGTNPKTLKRALSGLNGYWSYLSSHHLVADTNPFSVVVKERRTRVEVAKAKRRSYTRDEMKKLFEASRSDSELRLLIKIAAYSGGRRDAIVGLSDKSIVAVHGIPCIHFDDKTVDGIRDVPLHTELRELLSIKGAFFKSFGNNKYNKGDFLGKKFSALKTDLGFDEHYTFHSIRHTFSALMKQNGIEEAIAASIIGHKHDSITYGLYGSDANIIELKCKAIEVIKY